MPDKLEPQRSYTWEELGRAFDFAPEYLGRVGGMVSRPAHNAVLLITHPGGGKSFDYDDYPDGDGALDRHYGFDSYTGSGAWETNYQAGEYEDDATGELCKWNYFVKIVAVPGDADLIDGMWYAADGTEIGAELWNEFAVVEEVYNDQCSGEHGPLYVSPDHPGFGGW